MFYAFSIKEIKNTFKNKYYY